MKQSFDVIIIGGGTAGISVASRLIKRMAKASILLIEPASKHYYQPMWTLVGAGQTTKQSTERDEQSLIPKGVTWLKRSAKKIEPEKNMLSLDDGSQVQYEFLVVCPGIQQDWNAIEGLQKSLGTGGVCTNYDYNFVDYTWKSLKEFKSGKLVFTMPPMPIKCPGAPQKIMWLADDYLRRQGLRERCEVHFISAPDTIFGVPRYREPLDALLKERNIKTSFGKKLASINGQDQSIIMEDLKSGEREELSYDFLHVVPPMSAPDFIKESPLANESGWVDVDKHTLQHKRYAHVFSLGDACSAPCSKTGAAIRKQAPVVVENLISVMKAQEAKSSYDGYASCPLVTRKDRCILAEFGYDGKIMETFPFAQNKERWSMYLLKRYALPKLYWDFLLKGKA